MPHEKLFKPLIVVPLIDLLKKNQDCVGRCRLFLTQSKSIEAEGGIICAVLGIVQNTKGIFMKLKMAIAMSIFSVATVANAYESNSVARCIGMSAAVGVTADNYMPGCELIKTDSAADCMQLVTGTGAVQVASYRACSYINSEEQVSALEKMVRTYSSADIFFIVPISMAKNASEIACQRNAMNSVNLNPQMLNDCLTSSKEEISDRFDAVIYNKQTQQDPKLTFWQKVKGKFKK
jgi:hypothetical protein